MPFLCRDRPRIATALPLILTTLLIAALGGGEEPSRFERWEPAIAAFERQDEKQPPPKNGIVFVGSSSIRLWDLSKSFPEKPVINRGFGGSQLADSVHFADRLVFKHRPRTVVVYAGDNDLAAGLTPKQVARDFGRLVKRVRAELPDAKIVFIAVKPSPARWKLVERIREANRQIAEACAGDEKLAFVDVATPMLGEDSRPRDELFAKDELHLSPAGYRLWTRLVARHLE